MTVDKLELLAELDKKATPGEWREEGDGHLYAPSGWIGDTKYGEAENAGGNAAFIAALVNWYRSGGAELARDGLKYREPPKVYVQCEKHKGYAMWIRSIHSGGAYTPAKQVCPNCETEAARQVGGAAHDD